MKKIGRYEIVEELGRGAMGVVYKASDPTIGRMVAIKVLLLDDQPEGGAASARDTFLREARAAGRLSHPGIVTIHDALEDEATRSSYIVMEYIPGRTLEKTLISNPQIGPEKAFDITRQVAEALEYAHRNQIIHRDLKPANIILTEDGRAKITDFGIAKIAEQGAMRTVAIMGTPSYMSPEQVTGGEIDARADIFSMGILLYLMLVGEKPFAGDTAAVMFKIVYEDPVRPSKVNPKLTAADDYVVLRCLAKDRAKRYASAREFLDDLEDLRHGRPPRSQVRIPPSEFQAAERTVAVKQPLVSSPAASISSARPPVAQALPAEATAAIPPPPAAIPNVPPSPSVAPGPAPTPVVAPALGAPAPTAGAAPVRVKKLSSMSVVAGLAAVAVVAMIAAGIWISLRPNAPSSPGPRPAADVAAPLPSPIPETPPVTNTAVPSEKPVAENSRPESSTGNTPIRPPATPPKPTPRPAAPPALAKADSGPGTESSAEVQSAPGPAAPTPAASIVPVRDITVYCRHEFEDATLLLLDGERIIYQARLVGKKRRGFIGIGGKGFGGVLTETVTIPGDAQELTARVYSSDGALNVLQKISAHPPSEDARTLRITPTKDQLKLEWQNPKAAAK